MANLTQIEDILQTFTLEDILEENGLTEADALYYLVEQGFVELPEHLPL